VIASADSNENSAVGVVEKDSGSKKRHRSDDDGEEEEEAHNNADQEPLRKGSPQEVSVEKPAAAAASVTLPHPPKQPHRSDGDNDVSKQGVSVPAEPAAGRNTNASNLGERGVNRDEEADDNRTAASASATSSASSYVEYRWLDAGEIVQDRKNPRRLHSGIRLTVRGGKPFEVRLGDAVMLASSSPPPLEDDTRNGEGEGEVLLCRVVELSEPVDMMETSNRGDGGDQRDTSNNSVSEIMFRGQWLYGRSEVLLSSQYGSVRGGGNWAGIMDRDELLRSLGPRELLWTDHFDENPISSIMKKVTVVYYQDRSTKPSPTKPRDPLHPFYFVRYKVHLTSRSWTVSQWSPKDNEINPNDDQDKPRAPAAGVAVSEARNSETMDIESLSSAMEDDHDGSSDDDDDDDDDDTESSLLSGDDRELLPVMPEGEGSSLRAAISVGSKHQVTVPKFEGPVPVRSRHPTLVWSPGQISELELHKFCHQLALIVNPYLRERGLTMTDPYTPLPADRTEQLVAAEAERLGMETFRRLQPTVDPWIRTGSHVSTAGRLTGDPNPLLKECNADAVLEFLHRHKYDTRAAMEVVRARPLEVLPTLVSAFTRAEKRSFDEAFRYSSGSLRKVADGMEMPLKDVVDYWYRFKIPSQFRVYQDKKREQALRIIECIEKRSAYNAASVDLASSNNIPSSHLALSLPSSTSASRRGLPLPPRQNPQLPGHWSERAPTDVTAGGALEERRLAARGLLSEVRTRLGMQAVKRMSALFNALSDSYDDDTKEEFYDILEPYPDLRKKFREFIP
jgi:hypothetical protein